MSWVEGKNRERERGHCGSDISPFFHSMILNPNGAYYTQLKSVLEAEYEDLVWSEDVVFLERNSRTFKERSKIINGNTEALCDFLIDHPKGKSGLTAKKRQTRGC